MDKWSVKSHLDAPEALAQMHTGSVGSDLYWC